MSNRLSLKTLSTLPEDARPSYDPAAHGAGIVHIGVGAFHRAHQAVYTDTALAKDGGDWRIDGVSLRSTDIADALNPQDGLFTLVEQGGQGTSARVIGSLRQVIAATRASRAVLEALCAPQTRIVSVTVTEKAYGIDRAAGTIDTTHPAIAADLENPRTPVGVIGLLVEGLRLRRENGHAPYTVLCCDNLPDNGELLRAGVLDFARRIDPALSGWIEDGVAFPSTMVDRITPAPLEETRTAAEKLTGLHDNAPVATEPFTQWVIEDNFPQGRPAWEEGGAIFVKNVAPYEAMKLRMLNGTHSMLAYSGFLSGHKYVRDVIRDEALARLVRRHLNAAAASLKPLEGIDFGSYADALAQRFANPAIAHETYQIAMDGTEKLPQRIFAPALHALENGLDIRPFAFATAVWMRYCTGRLEDGQSYALRDPREQEIASAIAGSSTAEEIANALSALPGLFPAGLRTNRHWNALVSGILATMLESGVIKALQEEANQG